MPSVLSSTNGWPNMPFPQHLSGKTNTVQSFLYPGAVQPNVNPPPPNVLSYTNSFPNMPFPQHLSGKTNTVQSFLFPGAVQPPVNSSTPPLGLQNFNAFIGRRVAVIGY